MRIHFLVSRKINPTYCFVLAWFLLRTAPGAEAVTSQVPLPKIRVAADHRGFVSADGKPFMPFGVTYFRPGTGWAPQVWKKFDAEATRRDFDRLRQLGGNCVRVFLTFGSFYEEPGKLSLDGLGKFDQFLALAEAAGLYVHPTGPDHWEGLPDWARGDRIANEKCLEALEQFWRLFAARYRGRNVIFGYDLLNEPEVAWDTPAMRPKWHAWLKRKYGDSETLSRSWARPVAVELDSVNPPGKDALPNQELLDYQLFREELAEQWARRQVKAIKSADPEALVTIGLIQWSVPVLLAGSFQYSGFRPCRLAPLLDFMEVHFYPLADGFYEYLSDESELRNLAYLESVVRETARCGKPTVVAEFGWYGGGKLSIGDGRHPAASEQQQARWCRKVVESTTGWACGWLNWGFHDHPGAGDVTELTGLLKVDDQVKAWGVTFQELVKQFEQRPPPTPPLVQRPILNWELNITDRKARNDYRDRYFKAFAADARKP